VQGSVARRPDGGEDDLRAVFVFHDVTALKKLERVRSDFIANVSHELRTPLTAIIGYLEALLDGAQDDPRQREEFLRTIKTHADRLGALVHDLLQLSQIESGDYRWRRVRGRWRARAPLGRSGPAAGTASSDRRPLRQRGGGVVRGRRRRETDASSCEPPR
jgi:signal transduction histidine kinase